jgi:hypothetical protein
MNSNLESAEDTFDDVEGHAARSGHIDGADTDDVEGHSIRGRR